MEYLTDKLIKNSPYEYDEFAKKNGGEFYDALIEELRFHYDNNSMYRRFCDNKNFNPYLYEGSLANIPPVHVNVFKELGDRLNSVSEENIKLTLQSSATSGRPSSILVDPITSKRQTRSMIKVMGDFIGNERKPFLIMDVDPASGFRKLLGARYAAVSGYLNFASDVGYFLKVNDDQTYYFDSDGIIKYINDIDDQAAVVFGFTYILYSEVIKPLTEKGVEFNLPKGSKVIHIGGWKKLENEKISKEQFNTLAAKLFGISEADVIDVYGFTEQMGLNYPDCQCGFKHTPLYSEVIIRDPVTKEILPPGKDGLLEFVSPVPHSYPGNVVLTDDIGVIINGKCDCGRAGTRFKVLGRMKNTEIRGCGDVLSSKLRFSNNIKEKASGLNSISKEMILYYEGIDKAFSDDYSTVFSDLENDLRSQLDWLRDQPIDALIGLISLVADEWKRNLNRIPVQLNQGLSFLISWCSPANLLRIANDGFRGNRHYADSFVSMDDNGVRLMRSTSKGVVCHWLAGNVQVLGMFVLIQSILTKNVNILRVSGRDDGAFQTLISSFDNIKYTTPGGYSINGEDLLKTIAIVRYDHNNSDAGTAMSRVADVRIAWGGNEAVSTVMGYSSKYNCEDVIMGPKLSMAVVAKESLQDTRVSRKLARKIAIDASVFDQTGCASAHNVFVERGGGVSPSDFAALLAEGMGNVAKQLPKGMMTPEEYSKVHSARCVFDFKGTVYGDDESIWTVLFSEELECNIPIYSRVLFVHAIDKLDDVLEYLDEGIQTIGLASSGEKAMEFASKAARRGVVRFPMPGKMLNFESPWDGMFIMDKLIIWNTLGGPIV